MSLSPPLSVDDDGDGDGDGVAFDDGWRLFVDLGCDEY